MFRANLCHISEMNNVVKLKFPMDGVSCGPAKIGISPLDRYRLELLLALKRQSLQYNCEVCKGKCIERRYTCIALKHVLLHCLQCPAGFKVNIWSY